MRTKFLLWLLISLVFSPLLSFAQMKPQNPAQVKVPTIGKTYWCAEVEDILFSKEPQQGEKLSVGVRVKLTKKTIIHGAPGQKLCNCAFEGPPDAMSIRLIGIKYSETETNLLEYYGPTPAFPPYDYSGFQVIGFRVTENDLKKGYIDVWGWASKEPLQCRDATIYASFAVYKQSPYNQQNECHPHPDFKKSFKPKCLQVPKIDEERLKEGIKRGTEVLRSLPDLKIAKVEIFPKISKRENEQAIIYDEATLKINILNSGHTDASKFKVKIERKWEWEEEYYPETGMDSRYDVGYFYGGKWHSEKSGKIVNGIIEIEGLQANGGQRTIFIYVDNSLAPKADCFFRVIVDSDKEVPELDESNNGITDILFPSHYNHPEKYKK